MDKKMQNSVLITTSNNDDGETIVTYIPLNIDVSVVDFFLKNGGCTNKEALSFKIVDGDANMFWSEMWRSLKDD